MIIVLLGPTCSGKSSLAIKIASFVNGVIVNADPYQAYKELNIGVAKPSEEDFKKVKHYLYSIQSVDEPLTIYSFQKIFRNCIDNLLKENVNIVVVSGSGLYLKSALYDYDFVQFKVDNKEKYLKLSNEELYQMLIQRDKETANKIHINNRKRIIHALDILDNLPEGVNKIDFENKQSHKCIYDNVHFLGLNIDREILYSNINNRVDEMIKNGLKDEAINVFKNHPSSLSSLTAIGYKEVLLRIVDSEIINLIKKNTRNYAKRQMTFFKNQFENVIWFDDSSKLYDYVIENYGRNI